MSAATESASSAAAGAPGLLSQKEYARRRGWSKQYVNQLVKQGKIPLVNGRIDPVAADAALAGMRDPSRGAKFRSDGMAQGPVGPSSGFASDPPLGIQGTFAKARTVREHFRAMKEKMEYEAAVGTLVSRRDVEDAACHVGVVFRTHMMGAAGSIGAQIAERFKVDPEVAIELVTAGVTQALYALADKIRNDEWGFDKGLPSRGNGDEARES